MQKWIANGCLAFSIGLLAGLLLPQCLTAVTAAVLLVIISLVTKRCYTF